MDGGRSAQLTCSHILFRPHFCESLRESPNNSLGASHRSISQASLPITIIPCRGIVSSCRLGQFAVRWLDHRSRSRVVPYRHTDTASSSFCLSVLNTGQDHNPALPDHPQPLLNPPVKKTWTQQGKCENFSPGRWELEMNQPFLT